MGLEPAHPGDAPPLSVEDLCVAFRSGGRRLDAVRGVSFEVGAGARVALVGESGSGKSITALAAMGMLPPGAEIVHGNVRVGGTSIADAGERRLRALRGRQVAMVYQNPLAALNPLQRVGVQVGEAIEAHGSHRRGDTRRRVLELLDEVGIADPARRAKLYPHELSGGMRQRIVLAIALAGDPSVLIADEPTTALDVTTQAKILELLGAIVARRAMSVLLITHDLAIASSFCSSVIVMYAGRIVESSCAERFFAGPAHPYSAGLLGSACDLTIDPARRLVAIPGQVPILGDYPEGCAFHPRCARSEEVCRQRFPARVTVGPDHQAECWFPVTAAARHEPAT